MLDDIYSVLNVLFNIGVFLPLSVTRLGDGIDLQLRLIKRNDRIFLLVTCLFE